LLVLSHRKRPIGSSAPLFEPIAERGALRWLESSSGTGAFGRHLSKVCCQTRR
jgi:hypothetical protein